MKKKIAAARAAMDKAMNAVYAFAPDGQTPFWECMKLATSESRIRYEIARDRLIALECEAVARGKAWRSTFGTLCWYR